MSQKLNILLSEAKDFSETALALASQAGQITQKDIQESELPWAFANFDVFWFRLGFRITEELLRMPGRRVSVIVCPVTGLDHIETEICKELGIEVVSLKGETAFLNEVRATAELTIGLTLALLRKIPQANASVKAGQWNRELFKGSEILGKTVGIIGMGRLGKIVARYFQAFGAAVQGFDIRTFEANDVRQAASLKELVGTSDIVSLHVNYYEGTHHLVNETLLACFKKGAILINTSRGRVIDSKALVNALENGWLAGAALDVIENEQQPSRSKLILYAKTHDNLLITPHIGGNTLESFAKTEVFAAKKLIAHLQPEMVHG